jgi:hypothetical protein
MDVQSAPEFSEYESEIGESARLASEIFEGFHSMRIPVPVDPFKYSPPLGKTSASEATDGLVESTVKVTDPLAELPS